MEASRDRYRSLRPSPAMAVALLALFVALGGSAVAARIAVNSVKSKHIAKGQVKRQDLAAGAVDRARLADRAVNGAKLEPGAILGGHIADGAITGAHVDESSLGQVPSAAISSQAANLATPDGQATADQLLPDVGSGNDNPSPDLALGSNETTVLTAPVRSQLSANRFFGSASVTLYSGLGAGSASCYMMDGWGNPISQTAYATFSATGQRAQLPVIGVSSAAPLNGELPSGNLAVRCTQVSGDVRFDRGTMFVLTVPTFEF